VVSGPYRVVRHPEMLGSLLAFWGYPCLTWSRLLLAGSMTAWVACAVRWEEQDLVATFGDDYRAYRAQVPALLPTLWPLVKTVVLPPKPDLAADDDEDEEEDEGAVREKRA